VKNPALWAHTRHFFNIRPVFEIGEWFLANFPPLWGYAVTRWMAQVTYPLVPRMVRALRNNARQVLRHTEPGLDEDALDRKACAVARSIFVGRGRAFVDQSLLAGARSVDRLFKFRFEGPWEKLQAAYARGKGVILASAHLGEWYGGGMAVSRLGLPIRSVTYRTHGNERMIRRLARKGDVQYIYVDGSPFSMMEILRALGRGEAVTLLADRPWDSQSLMLPFFGRPAPFPIGPVRIARLAEVPIFPAFCVRRAGFEFTATLCDPIEVLPGGDPIAAEREALGKLVRVMEDFVARHLGSWYLFEPVWDA
jgi:KDO2-lipid IV(A) lauroyltransferase